MQQKDKPSYQFPIGEEELITHYYRRLISLGQFEPSPQQTDHNLHLKQINYITEDGLIILNQLKKLCEVMAIEFRVDLWQRV